MTSLSLSFSLMAEREEELKSHLIWVKEECEKDSLKLIIKKKNIIIKPKIIWSHQFMANKRERGGSSDREFSSSWALNSLWMVTTVMKL